MAAAATLLLEELSALPDEEEVRHRPFATCSDGEVASWCRMLSAKSAIECIESSSPFCDGEWFWHSSHRLLSRGGGSWIGDARCVLRFVVDKDCPDKADLEIVGRIEAGQGGFVRVEAASGPPANLDELTSISAIIRFYDECPSLNVALLAANGARVPATLETPATDLLLVAAATNVFHGGKWSKALRNLKELWGEAPRLVNCAVVSSDPSKWSPTADDDADFWTSALRLGIGLPVEDDLPAIDLRVVDCPDEALNTQKGCLGALLRNAEDSRIDRVELVGPPLKDILYACQSIGLRLHSLEDMAPSPHMLKLLAHKSGVAFFRAEGHPALQDGAEFFLMDATHLVQLQLRDNVFFSTSRIILRGGSRREPVDEENEAAAMIAACYLTASDRIYIEAMAAAEIVPTKRICVDQSIVRGMSACLDADQQRFVNSIDQGPRASFCGPPGSGRTTALAHAVAVAVAHGCRVLVVAQKHETFANSFDEIGVCRTLVLGDDDSKILTFLSSQVMSRQHEAPSVSIRPLDHQQPLLLHGLEQAAWKARDDAVALSKHRVDDMSATSVKQKTRSQAFKALRAYAARGVAPSGTEKSLAERFAKTEGWADLVAAAAPVVVATFDSLSRWIGPNQRVFDVLCIDDFDPSKKAQLKAATTRFCDEYTLLTTTAMNATRANQDAISTSSSYGGASLFPFALDETRLSEKLASVGVTRSGGMYKREGSWPARRVETTLKGVAKLLAKCRREQELPPDVLEKTCYSGDRIAASFRALRGATVRIGHACAALETFRALSQAIAAELSTTKRLSLVCVCADASQAKLLDVLFAAEENCVFEMLEVRHAKSFEDNDLVPGACDIVFLDALPPKYKKLCQNLARAARVACVDFSSNPLHDIAPVFADAMQSCPPPEWAEDLLRRAQSFPDAAMQSSRLVPVVANRRLFGIANFDSLVLCHPDEESSSEHVVALAASLRHCFGWRRVLHLCAPPSVADRGAIAAGLVADLCSWRRCVDFETVTVEQDRLSATVKVSGPVPALALRAIRVRVLPALPWRPVNVAKKRPIFLERKVALEHTETDTILFEIVAGNRRRKLPGGSTHVFELTEPTSQAPLATRSAAAPPCLPEPPAVARIRVQATVVVVLLRLRGARASAWNDTAIDFACALCIGQEEHVVARYSSSSEEDANAKIVSLTLEPSDPKAHFSVTCRSENSAGSSRTVVVADDLRLQDDDDEHILLDDDLDDEEIELGYFDEDAGVAPVTVEQPNPFVDDDHLFFAENDEDDVFDVRVVEGRVLFAGTAGTKIEFEYVRWRTDAPETEKKRVAVETDSLDEDNSCSLRHLAELFTPKHERQGTILFRAQARCMDAWTMPPIVFAFDDWESNTLDATARVFDAWREDEEDTLTCLAAGDKLVIFARFSFDGDQDDDYSLRCALNVTAEAVMSDGERIELRVSLDSLSSERVATLTLSSVPSDRATFYRSALTETNPFEVRLKATTCGDTVVRQCSTAVVRPVENVTARGRSLGGIHPLASDAVERLLCDERFETVADVANAARRVAARCLEAELLAFTVKSEESRDVQVLSAMALNLWHLLQSDSAPDPVCERGAKIIFESMHQTRCRPIPSTSSSPESASQVSAEQSKIYPLRTFPLAIDAVLRAFGEQRPQFAALVAYLRWIHSENLSPESCEVLLQPFMPQPSLEHSSVLDSLLCDVTHDADWTERRDHWQRWLTLTSNNSNVAHSLASVLLSNLPVAAVVNGDAESGLLPFAFTISMHQMQQDEHLVEAALCLYDLDIVEWIVPVIVEIRGASLRLTLDGMPFFNPSFPAATRARMPRPDLAANTESTKAVLYRGRSSGLWKEHSPRLNALRLHEFRVRASRAYAGIFSGELSAVEDIHGPTSTVALASIADHTQRRAVSSVLAGQSFVCRGPPGTGKSSTIANAALALAAAGKTVLVVGQEEAAVRVVASKVQALSCSSPQSRRSLLCATAEDLISARKGKSRHFAYNLETQNLVDTWSRLRDTDRLPPGTFASDHIVEGWSLFRYSYREGTVEGRLSSEDKNTDNATPYPEESTSDDLDIFLTVLHRGRMRDGTPREWRYVCELCGERRASAATARRHVAKHVAVAASANAPQHLLASQRKKASKQQVAATNLTNRIDELHRWQSSPRPTWSQIVAEASLGRIESALRDLEQCEAAQRDALRRLAAADRAERDAVPVGAEFASLRDVAATCLGAADAYRDHREIVNVIALPFAVEQHHDQSAKRLISLARLLLADEEGEDMLLLGVAPALAGLEQVRDDAFSCTSETKVVADALYDSTPVERMSLATLLVACVEIVALFSSQQRRDCAVVASRELVRSAQKRRVASLGLAGARADAKLFNDLCVDDGAACLPPILCATPASARQLGVLDSAGGTFDAVFIDEASQMRTRDAVALVAAASTAVVVAGDDQQLPPRHSKSSSPRGLLDDALEFGRLPLVPLEWHYRSGDPTLIAVSNSLFYGSRLVAPLSAPGGGGGLIPVLTFGPMESDRGPPAGLVNRAQALAVSRDAADIIARCDADGTSVSLGIVTLNRPQRGLIFHLLLADHKARLEPHPEQRGALRRRRDADRDPESLDRDAPIFVESIDYVQGEERDFILFSTLLAPRNDAPHPHAKSNKAKTQATTAAQVWDALEEVAASSSSEDDETATSARRKTSSARPTSSIRHYSTLTHAHGHRLLNVGITRAIKTMRCYVHPECPAPPPHDERPGRRAFGWLVRALLGRDSPCSCVACQELSSQLVGLCAGRRQHRNEENKVEDVESEEVNDGTSSNEKSPLLDEKRFVGERQFSRAVSRWLVREAESSGGKVVCLEQPGTNRATVDFAVQDVRGQNVAVMASTRAEDCASWLDHYDSMPQALLHPKLGWSRVSRIEPSDVLKWIFRDDDMTLPMSERVLAALDRLCQGAQSFTKSVFHPEERSHATTKEHHSFQLDGRDWLIKNFGGGENGGMSSVRKPLGEVIVKLENIVAAKDSPRVKSEGETKYFAASVKAEVETKPAPRFLYSPVDKKPKVEVPSAFKQPKIEKGETPPAACKQPKVENVLPSAFKQPKIEKREVASANKVPKIENAFVSSAYKQPKVEKCSVRAGEAISDKESKTNHYSRITTKQPNLVTNCGEATDQGVSTVLKQPKVEGWKAPVQHANGGRGKKQAKVQDLVGINERKDADEGDVPTDEDSAASLEDFIVDDEDGAMSEDAAPFVHSSHLVSPRLLSFNPEGEAEETDEESTIHDEEDSRLSKPATPPRFAESAARHQIATTERRRRVIQVDEDDY